MAKYRVKDNPRSHDPRDPQAVAGTEFEWDGVTVDYEGDVCIAARTEGYVLPEHVELIEPVNAGRVVKTTKTVEQEVYVLTLSKEEANLLYGVLDDLVDEQFGSLGGLFDDFTEVL